MFFQRYKYLKFCVYHSLSSQHISQMLFPISIVALHTQENARTPELVSKQECAAH